MIATASYALGFSAASTAPCDILAAAGTPCVAAHSMVRALYAATPMGAPLYTVYREDDRLSEKTITVNSKGMADTDAQDAFCDGQWGHCIVLKIFDQSPNGNDLELAPPVVALRLQHRDGVPDDPQRRELARRLDAKEEVVAAPRQPDLVDEIFGGRLR